LSHVLNTPEKYRIHKQIDHDYIIAKENFVTNNISIEKIESNEKINLWSDIIEDIQDITSMIKGSSILSNQNSENNPESNSKSNMANIENKIDKEIIFMNF